MQVEVLDGGLAVSIQDLGRIGYYRYGIPMGGAMDRESLRIANLLVGNEENSACFEAPFIGPKLRFKDHRRIAVTESRTNEIFLSVFHIFENVGSFF